MLAPWKKNYDQSRQHIKKQRHYFTNKGLSNQSHGFSSGHVWMWELDCEESWVQKSWCFWTVMLEKTLESPLDCKEIQPVHPKGDQFWVFIGRTDVEAETPNTFATWCEELTHLKRPWCWKRLKAGEEGDDRGWDVGWHHWFNGHKFEQNLGECEAQGSLACSSPWGCKESDATKRLNKTTNVYINMTILLSA